MAARSRHIRNRAVAQATPPQRFTHLDKVLFPDDGFTKGDLIRYALAIAPWALPYLRDRPLAVERWPDGLQATGPCLLPEARPGPYPGVGAYRGAGWGRGRGEVLRL